jgi:hypothetical protein
VRKQRLTRTFDIILYIMLSFGLYEMAIPSSRKPLYISTLHPIYAASLLLPRSATPNFWLLPTPSIKQPSGRPASFQRPLPTSNPAPIIRHERIHQLLGSGQFRFGYPRVLPLDPIVPLIANQFLADDFVDFSFIIRIYS